MARPYECYQGVRKNPFCWLHTIVADMSTEWFEGT
jgi:hypothetical protein